MVADGAWPPCLRVGQGGARRETNEKRRNRARPCAQAQGERRRERRSRHQSRDQQQRARNAARCGGAQERRAMRHLYVLLGFEARETRPSLQIDQPDAALLGVTPHRDNRRDHRRRRRHDLSLVTLALIQGRERSARQDAVTAARPPFLSAHDTSPFTAVTRRLSSLGHRKRAPETGRIPMTKSLDDQEKLGGPRARLAS